MKRRLSILISCIFILILKQSMALRVPLPAKNDDVFGTLQNALIAPEQNLFSIARQYDLGFFELLQANPHIDPEALVPGTDLILPTRFILPPAKRQGIVINLGTMRLYYFPKDKPYFYTYPIGIGKENWDTPLGKFSIIEKTKDPYWFVPESIYEYRKAHGDPVPKVIKPGEDNPLGHYAMRLSKPTYLIHGTNNPNSVGVRSSAGCIHLYPEDIKELFAHVPLQTSVTIINQPYLVGWEKRQLLLEAHLPLAEVREQYADLSKHFAASLQAQHKSALKINQQQTLTTISNHLGVPTVIGQIP